MNQTPLTTSYLNQANVTLMDVANNEEIKEDYQDKPVRTNYTDIVTKLLREEDIIHTHDDTE